MAIVKETAWLHIDPGKKRNQISIKNPTVTQNTVGQSLPGQFTPVISGIWAAIETKTDRQVYQEGFVAQVVHKIYIDWPGIPITDDMVVVNGAGTYEIQTVENVQERNLVMCLTCIEIDGTGA